MTVEELRALDESRAFKIIKFPKSYLLRRESDGYEWRITRNFAIDLTRDQRVGFDIYNEDGIEEQWWELEDLYKRGAMITSFRLRDSGWMRYYEYIPPTDEELIERYEKDKKLVRISREERLKEEAKKTEYIYKVSKTRKRKYTEFVLELITDKPLDQVEDRVNYRLVFDESFVKATFNYKNYDGKWNTGCNRSYSFLYKDEKKMYIPARETLMYCLQNNLPVKVFIQSGLNEFELNKDSIYILPVEDDNKLILN